MSETESKQTAGRQARRAKDNDTLDYSLAAAALWRFKWLLLILIAAGAVISVLYNRKQFVPKYESSATFTVGTQSSVSSGGLDEYTFYYVIGTTTKLSQSFPSVLSSQILQDKICEDLGISYLPVTLSVEAVPDSNLFTMKAQGTDPQMVYDVLLSAIRQMPDAAKHVIGNIKLNPISMPQGVPTSCYNKPDHVKNALGGAAVGLVIGLAWVLAYAWLRKTIRSKEDIRNRLNMDTMGVIPAVIFKKYKTEIDRSVLITNERVSSRFKEAVRVFRNTLTNRLKDTDKVVLLTSTAPGEGKSTIVGNLALALTDIGKKVLIIDADLRKPSINEEFGVENELLDVVTTGDAYSITLVPDLNVPVLTFNTQKRRYWDIMNADYLHPLIRSLRDQYDYILIDTPPCGLISDTLVIAEEADAALYVILQDTIRLSRIRNSLANLASSDVKILGCVLNGVSIDGSAYGRYNSYGYYNYGRYGYGSRYGYGYGYGSRYGERRKNAKDPDSGTAQAPEVKD